MINRKASTFQIIATVLIIIAGFLLLVVMSVEKIKKESISVQQYGKEYTGVIAEKGPEYTEKSSVQGAYQAIYETGLRGGLTNESVKSLENEPVTYGIIPDTIDIATAVWRDYNSIKNHLDDEISIPTSDELSKNISDRIKNKTLEYTERYGSIFNLELEQLEEANYTVNRTDCIDDVSNKEWCFNVTITTENKTAKEYTAGGEKISEANVLLSTKTHLELREFGLYELLKSFMKNNVIARTGGGGENLLAETLEEDNVCSAGTDCDWDTSTHTTEYCPTQDNCDYSATGSNARLDYSCIPQLQSPAEEMIIEANIQNEIIGIANGLNSLISADDVLCPNGIDGCDAAYYSPYELNRNPITGETYRTDRFRWTIEPAAPKTWADVIHFSPTDDDYTVLWWDQENTGECQLPWGTEYLADTQPSTPENNDGKDIMEFSDKTNYPEGTACADSYYTGCHKVWNYIYKKGKSQQKTSCGGSTSTCEDYSTPEIHQCEDPAHRDDIAHQPISAGGCGVPPVGDGWCDEVETTRYYTNSWQKLCPYTCWDDFCYYSVFYGKVVCFDYSYSCNKWETIKECKSEQLPAEKTTVHSYTHCDITYDTYGHFKYRVAIDPLLVTVTDKSKLIPVDNVLGQTIQKNPEIKAIYKGVINEAPSIEDGCLDEEAGEGRIGDRYFEAASTDLHADSCPIERNPLAQKTDYY